MDLTTDEIALVQRHRDSEAHQRASLAFQGKAISTAQAWWAWSENSGEGLTFSTFVNAFEYQGSYCKAMYEAVERILEAARPRHMPL